MRLNFIKTIWWWQFRCGDRWTLECITQIMCMFFYYLAQNELRSFHINLRPLESCYMVLVPALHSRIKITLFTMCSKLNSKFLMKFSNSSFGWQRDLERLTQFRVLSLVLISKLIHSWGYDKSITFRDNPANTQRWFNGDVC